MDLGGAEAGGAWGDEDDLEIGDDGEVMVGAMAGEDDDDLLDGEEKGTGWAEDDDLDLDLPDLEPDANVTAGSGFVCPTKGLVQSQVWANNSQLPGDHVTAGAFDSAFRLLKDQVGVVKYDEFKEIFMNMHVGSKTSFVAMPGLPPLFCYPHRNYKDAGARGGLPQNSLKLTDLVNNLQDAYKLITQGKFEEAILKFRKTLLSVPLLVLDTKQQIQEAQQLISIAKNYILGFSMEITRKSM